MGRITMCIGSIDFRYIVVKGVLYVRKEDAVNYIKQLASTEETDVRNRLTEAADSLDRRVK